MLKLKVGIRFPKGAEWHDNNIIAHTSASHSYTAHCQYTLAHTYIHGTVLSTCFLDLCLDTIILLLL